MAVVVEAGGGGLPQKLRKCAGRHFRGYALVWVVRRELFTSQWLRVAPVPLGGRSSLIVYPG